ncbi:MAG: hypothetical protein AAFV71_14730 [Cyanobacteria bacterium J06633_8]
MGESRRRKQLLGDAYGQAKPGRVYVNGKDAFIAYLQSGSEWDKAEELKKSNSNFYEDAIFTRNIKLDFAADESYLIGCVKFTSNYKNDICADVLWSGSDWKLPRTIGKRLVDDNLEQILQEIKREVRSKLSDYLDICNPDGIDMYDEWENY